MAAGAGELVDHGQWAFGGSELSLVSDGDSATCSSGDRLVISGLETADGGTDFLRGSVDQNTCGGAWASTTDGWFVIPDAR